MNGALTEWLGSGLQNRPQQFESAGHLFLSKRDNAICVISFYFYIKPTMFRRNYDGEP